MRTRAKTRVLIQMGPGGVGKTTVSVAYGMKWAFAGKKVLVMTIDPSKRLAQALGVSPASGIKKVAVENIQGELYASLLDHSSIFDQFISKIAQKNAAVEKLFSNKLYQSLKTRLQGSQDFTALIELYNQASSGEFDIVILDTPPAQHAWQFLEAPEKLGSLFREKVMKWFRWMGEPDGAAGFWGRVISSGTQSVLKALEVLTGQEFMLQISDFFKSIHASQEQLREKINHAQELLADADTEFTLVTTQDELKMLETAQFARQIAAKGFHVRRIIINRAWPQGELGDISYLNSHEQSEMNRLAKLFRSREQLNEKQLGQLPKGVQILKIYDTLKSSHDLKRLMEMAHDMKESVK